MGILQNKNIVSIPELLCKGLGAYKNAMEEQFEKDVHTVANANKSSIYPTSKICTMYLLAKRPLLKCHIHPKL
jgi:hypothetical protein